MLEELRAAVRRLESVPGGGGSVRIPHEFLRARSKSAEGIELRRLSAILLSSGTGGGTGTDREAGRHLAAAVSAAARSAVLHAQLALWMEGIRRIAARARTASLERRLTTGKPGRCPPSRRP